MYTMKKVSYHCDECHKIENRYKCGYKCPACGLNLCFRCYNKHKSHLCKWCEAKIPKSITLRLKLITLFYILYPLLVLIIPIPKPTILLLLEFNLDDINFYYLLGFIFGGLFILLILSKITQKKMQPDSIKKIPDNYKTYFAEYKDDKTEEPKNLLEELRPSEADKKIELKPIEIDQTPTQEIQKISDKEDEIIQFCTYCGYKSIGTMEFCPMCGKKQDKII